MHINSKNINTIMKKCLTLHQKLYLKLETNKYDKSASIFMSICRTSKCATLRKFVLLSATDQIQYPKWKIQNRMVNKGLGGNLYTFTWPYLQRIWNNVLKWQQTSKRILWDCEEIWFHQMWLPLVNNQNFLLWNKTFEKKNKKASMENLMI